MRNKDELIDIIKNSNIKDLVFGAQKSRIKRLIKTEKLDSAIVDKLWEARDLRIELSRFQELSDNAIDYIIDNIISRKNYKVSSAIYGRMIHNQKLKPSHLKKIDEDLKGSIYYFVAWEAKPEEMFCNCNFTSLLEYFDDVSIAVHSHVPGNNKASFSDLAKAIINIISVIPSTKSIIIDKIIGSHKNYVTSEVAKILCKRIFLEDVYINMMKEGIGEYMYSILMETLIVHNNCSQNKKALFFLEKL